MKRPLLIVTISYILGIIIGVYFKQSILFILLTGITGIVFLKIIKKKKIVIIAICIVPCFLSCQQTNNLNNKYNKMYKLDNENIAITGTVCSQIKETDYKYSVNIKIGNFAFPTKRYGDISLPAGFYDALRVEIGSASGQNWWCVMFPPLCFVDVSSGVVPEESKEVLQENLSYEEYNLLSENQNNSDMNFKFKIVELFQNIGIKLAQS